MIAPARAKRPGAKSGELEPPSEEELLSCPFCEGREDHTPPEVLALGGAAGRAPDTPGWQVRVVPNLYPAFERQEVVVHGPAHTRTLAGLDGELLGLVAEAWRLRARAAEEQGFPYVHALVNEGREAGASLSHSHSQLVWLRDEPPVAAAEHDTGECRVCAAVEAERAEGTRIVTERGGLVLYCPYAGRMPYELLAAPLEHEEDGFESALLGPALRLVAEAVGRLTGIEGPRPFNLWLHARGHWHLELLPRMTILAGLELGAGYHLNPLAPENAAAALREAGARPAAASAGPGSSP